MQEAISVKKDMRWQIARGLAIVCVILIHCPNASRAPFDSIEFNSWLVLRQFINFPVALFFFIAGKFTNYNKYSDYHSFLINRGGIRLLIPFLCWSIFYAMIKVVVALVSGEDLSVGTVLLQIITGKTAPHLYYIVALLQLTLLTPILINVIKKGYALLIYLLSAAWLAFIYCWCYLFGTMPPFYQTLFPAWVGFYTWGLCSRNNQSVILINPLLIGVAVLLEISEAYFAIWQGFPVNLACSQIRISAFFLTIIVICLFNNLHDNKSMNVIVSYLAYLGNRSYGIYYAHYFFLLLCVRMVRAIPVQLFGLTWLFQAVLSFVISIIGSLFLITIGRKVLCYFGNNRMTDILGF